LHIVSQYEKSEPPFTGKGQPASKGKPLFSVGIRYFLLGMQFADRYRRARPDHRVGIGMEYRWCFSSIAV